MLPAPSKSNNNSSGTTNGSVNIINNSVGGGTNSSGAPSPSPTSSGSRSHTPIRLTFTANSPSRPCGPHTLHEVAMAQKMLSRIEDMKGKKDNNAMMGFTKKRV